MLDRDRARETIVRVAAGIAASGLPDAEELVVELDALAADLEASPGRRAVEKENARLIAEVSRLELERENLRTRMQRTIRAAREERDSFILDALFPGDANAGLRESARRRIRAARIRAAEARAAEAQAEQNRSGREST